jgi:hypothetical protein
MGGRVSKPPAVVEFGMILVEIATRGGDLFGNKACQCQDCCQVALVLHDSVSL